MPVLHEIHGINKDNIQLVEDGLDYLLNVGGFNEAYGVCYNLNRYLLDNGWPLGCGVCGYSLVVALAHDYEHALRTPCGSLEDYFLPRTHGYGLWEGPNLVARLDLLWFLKCRVQRIRSILGVYVYTYGDMVQALNAVLGGRRDSSTGICSNFRDALRDVARGYYVAIDEAVAVMRGVFKKWPKFSGDTCYPVPHPEMREVCAYDTTSDLWEEGTEYGDNRFELARFCVAELSLVDPEMPALTL